MGVTLFASHYSRVEYMCEQNSTDLSLQVHILEQGTAKNIICHPAKVVSAKRSRRHGEKGEVGI